MSNISSKHPQFTHTCPDWTLMRDAYKGERHVKERGVVYLPPTEAMVKDGMNSLTAVGARAYHAYKMRARFSNFVREAVQMAIGMMHSQPPRIDLPEAMKDIRGFRGETLPELLRKINTEQLITGRVGLMADLPISPLPGQDIPCLSIYKTESIINWDDGNSSETVPQKLNLVVLDESGDVRDEIFGWKTQSKYRVLIMGDAQENEQFGRYTQGVFIDDAEYNPSMMLTPSWRGRTLQELPFVIINSCDVAADVDDPPLLDLGNICMTIYRGDADYRQNLFLQGQDTLVTVGANFDEDQEIRVGAGARIDLPLGGTAEYVGVGASGLSEQRAALDKLDSRAGSMGAQTLDSTSRERESGDSLRIRIAARTADMTQIAEAGAFGLQQILRTVATWMGEDPEKVVVAANKEFGESTLSGQDMTQMATARNLGFPMSARSMHDVARKRRMTTAAFEEEIAQAKKEEKEGFVFPKAGSGDQSPEQPNSVPEDESQKSGLESSDKKNPAKKDETTK